MCTKKPKVGSIICLELLTCNLKSSWSLSGEEDDSNGIDVLSQFPYCDGGHCLDGIKEEEFDESVDAGERDESGIVIYEDDSKAQSEPESKDTTEAPPQSSEAPESYPEPVSEYNNTSDGQDK